MSMIPGNLLDEQYDTQNPVIPTPSTGESYGAVYDQAIAKMPTVEVYNALKNISDQPEIPVADLNKQFPDNPRPFTKPLAYDSAKNVYDSNVAQAKSQEIINQTKWNPLEKVGKTAVDWLAPIADPLMAASFLATGPIAEFGAPLVKGAASVFGEGILARAAEIGLSGATHAALAAVPLEAASKFTTEAEGQNFTNEQLVSESVNLIGGVALFGGAIGLGIGALEKMAGKAKLAEKVFSSLKPNEQEAQIANQAAIDSGKGVPQTVAMGLTDTVATNEAKLGIEHKTGEEQAMGISEMTPANPFDIFNLGHLQTEFPLWDSVRKEVPKQVEIPDEIKDIDHPELNLYPRKSFNDSDLFNPEDTKNPEKQPWNYKEEFVNKAYQAKDLNSHETNQLFFSTRDEDFSILAEQKWRAEKKVLEGHFVGENPEDIAQIGADANNPLIQRFVRETYPDLMDSFIDKESLEGAEGDQAVINQRRREIYAQLEKSQHPLTRKLFYSDEGEQLPLKFTNQEVTDFFEASKIPPEDLHKQLTDQRQQQVKELQTNRLEALRESARNGTLNPETESPGIPKEHVSQPAVPINEALDHQISQIDEIQKNLDEEVNRGKTEEPLKEGEQKELSPAEEEDLRNESKFQDIKKVLDCFMKN